MIFFCHNYKLEDYRKLKDQVKFFFTDFLMKLLLLNRQPPHRINVFILFELALKILYCGSQTNLPASVNATRQGRLMLSVNLKSNMCIGVCPPGMHPQR